MAVRGVVLGKFSLVWFGPVWAKPETKPIKFGQTRNQTELIFPAFVKQFESGLVLV
jgi:hypothetical protein